MLDKIGIIGGGWIGGVLVQEIVQRRLAREVGLSDPAPMVNPDDPPERQETTNKQSVSKGKCLDIAEGTPVIRSDVRCVGSKDYSALAGSQLIINTAGVPRTVRPDGTYPSREELLEINLKITDAVAAGIKQYCPDAFVISVANPLDAIVYRLHLQLKDQLPKNKLMGMAGVLDSGRYCYFVAEAANVSVENVNAMVLGGHGDDMVPLVRYSTVAGIPITELLPQERIDAIVERTRTGGAEIVSLLKTGSAYYAPASAAVEMAETILKDKKKILPCAAYLQGEYGIQDLFIGVPVKLGAKGAEEIIEITLTNEEQQALQKSAAAVQELKDLLKTLA